MRYAPKKLVVLATATTAIFVTEVTIHASTATVLIHPQLNSLSASSAGTPLFVPSAPNLTTETAVNAETSPYDDELLKVIDAVETFEESTGVSVDEYVEATQDLPSEDSRIKAENFVAEILAESGNEPTSEEIAQLTDFFADAPSTDDLPAEIAIALDELIETDLEEAEATVEGALGKNAESSVIGDAFSPAPYGASNDSTIHTAVNASKTSTKVRKIFKSNRATSLTIRNKYITLLGAAAVSGLLPGGRLVSGTTGVVAETYRAKIFYSLVKTGGPWDLKRTDILSLKKKWYLNGLYLTGEDIGNAHYGYVGKVILYPDLILNTASGAVNTYHRSGIQWKYFRSYFDDPKDILNIKRGISMYKNSVTF